MTHNRRPAAPTLARWTAAARRPNLAAAATVTGKMVALAVAAQTAWMALLLPGSPAAPLTGLARLVGLAPETLTCVGWPFVAKVTEWTGPVVTAGLVTAPLVVGVGIALFRRGYPVALAEALHG